MVHEAAPATKKGSKKQQPSPALYSDAEEDEPERAKQRERRERMGNQDGLAEMSMPVLQAEPRCVADAAPTAAMTIPSPYYRAKPSQVLPSVRLLPGRRKLAVA